MNLQSGTSVLTADKEGWGLEVRQAQQHDM